MNKRLRKKKLKKDIVHQRDRVFKLILEDPSLPYIFTRNLKPKDRDKLIEHDRKENAISLSKYATGSKVISPLPFFFHIVSEIHDIDKAMNIIVQDGRITLEGYSLLCYKGRNLIEFNEMDSYKRSIHNRLYFYNIETKLKMTLTFGRKHKKIGFVMVDNIERDLPMMSYETRIVIQGNCLFIRKNGEVTELVASN
jgi:hypothetical protein